MMESPKNHTSDKNFSSPVFSKAVGFFCIFVLVFIDQITKILFTHMLQFHASLVVIPGVLELQYLENTGAAFSILNKNAMPLFYVLTPLFCIVLLYFFLKLPIQKRYRPLHWIFIFLLSGAIGNYIDRISLHYVRDFIYISAINFPVFNIADCYVSCSIIILIVFVLFYYSDQELSVLLPHKKNN